MMMMNSDTPQHCASGEHCINAVTLSSGEKVGYLFGELTAVGVEYVKEAIAEAEEGLGSGEVTELWRQHFRDKGYDALTPSPQWFHISRRRSRASKRATMLCSKGRTRLRVHAFQCMRGRC